MLYPHRHVDPELMDMNCKNVQVGSWRFPDEQLGCFRTVRKPRFGIMASFSFFLLLSPDPVGGWSPLVRVRDAQTQTLPNEEVVKTGTT